MLRLLRLLHALRVLQLLRVLRLLRVLHMLRLLRVVRLLRLLHLSRVLHMLRLLRRVLRVCGCWGCCECCECRGCCAWRVSRAVVHCVALCLLCKMRKVRSCGINFNHRAGGACCTAASGPLASLDRSTLRPSLLSCRSCTATTPPADIPTALTGVQLEDSARPSSWRAHHCGTRAIVYDDACHLMQFVMNKMHTTQWAMLMGSLVYRLDNLNFHRRYHSYYSSAGGRCRPVPTFGMRTATQPHCTPVGERGA
jgi:hypothetical protein